MFNKDYLRKKFLSKRKKYYFEVNNTFFNPLFSLLKKNKKKKLNLSIYFPTNFELNIIKILDIKNIKNSEILLPVVVKKNTLKFYKWSFKDPLKINQFGILEPILSNSRALLPDIMLIPLIAYDNSNYRLGYGKGYYDRYLNKNKNVTTIGIAFSFQKYHKLPTSKFDVKLDYILTEKGLK